jgi:tripartite-type tricarboxylate transporter receptor subunit TctC
MLKTLVRALATVALSLCATAAIAQSAPYPNKPVRIIVPYPPGGITDIAGRAVAQHLSETMGHRFIVENRAGAGGTIGAEAAARSAADGYTLFIGTSATNGTNPSTFARLPYNPTKDFAPVALIASAPLLVVVNPTLPVKSLSDLVAYLKANPNKASYASTGTGGSVHLTVELFKLMTGTQIVHIPYKGSSPGLTDLAGGHIQLMFDNMPSAFPQAQAGRLKALAVTSSRRSSLAPDLPTVAEAGVPGFSSTSWVGLYAPAGTPAEIITRLSASVNQGLKNPALQENFRKLGLDVNGGTPEDLARHQKAEIEKWANVVKNIGLVPE